MSFANKIIELIDGKVVKVDDNSSSEGMNGDEG